MNGKQVLEKVLEYKKMSYNELAKSIGLKRSQGLYDIRDGKIKRISIDLAEKITGFIPELNRVWILTGEGEMIIQPINQESFVGGTKNKVQNNIQSTVQNASDLQKENEQLKQTIDYLKSIIDEKNKLIDEKERMINILLKKS